MDKQIQNLKRLQETASHPDVRSLAKSVLEVVGGLRAEMKDFFEVQLAFHLAESHRRNAPIDERFMFVLNKVTDLEQQIDKIASINGFEL